MFNNVAINVAIGLIFIYLLYSLLATTIKEFIATLFAYRARMLERGIEQMLDGKNYSYYWWQKVANYFIWLFHLGKTYAANYSIKTQNKNTTDESAKPETKPAPLEVPVLSDFMTAKPDVIPASEGTTVKRQALNTKAKLFAAEITSHALYRRAAENSTLSKKPQYLGADVFSDILIDVLGAKGTGNNGQVLLKDIATFVDTNSKVNDELKKILKIYIEQANGDLQRFKLLVENWYDDTMDRVSGWYKKQSYRILLMLGFLLAVIFNISTIDIVKKLSTNSSLSENLANHATAYIKIANSDSSNKKLIGRDTNNRQDVPAKPESVNPTDSNRDTRTKDSTIRANDTLLYLNAQKNLLAIDSLYEKDIKAANTVLGLGWDDYGYAEKLARHIKDSANEQKAYDSIKSKNPLVAKVLTKSKPDAPCEPSFWDKLWYILCQTFTTPHKLIGFLITAFAISLGAPFWFDLLNKFINLRVSGAKPDGKSSTPVSKTAALNQKPDHTAKG